MKRLILSAFLLTLIVPVVYGAVGVLHEESVGRGMLIDAVSLQNGDSLVITVENHPHSHLPVFVFTYITVDGESTRQMSNVLPEHRAPDTVIVSACGGYVQVHANWVNDSNPSVMVYRFSLPSGITQVFLPLVCQGRNVLHFK
jgi:hypothetical protein